MSYIKPNLKKYESLKQLLESKDPIFYFENNLEVTEIIKLNRVLLVSEPGYGKTRLLKECLLDAERVGIFIDLKKLGKIDIQTYLQNENFLVLKGTERGEDLKNLKQFKTKSFKLKNAEDVIFCFDALDEVKQEDFAEVVENIKKFVNSYQRCNFLISCRKNYLEKWRHLFSEIDFSYIGIYPLELAKVKDFLSTYGIADQEEADDLIRKLNFENRKSLLRTPRYLEMIIQLKKEKIINNFDNITRGELFEKFIYHKLNSESEKFNTINDREIIKRVLEKLALVMEIYQDNLITKNELMDFFDDTKSNLNSSFLNQVPLDTFYERSLLKDNIDTIEFENTEFQEYLAAKEITRLGRVDQVIFDLAVVKELGEVHPSWVNTLSFLIEFDIKLLKNIIEYILSNGQRTHIEEHIKLLTKFNVEKLALEDRHSIFKSIVSYYQENAFWISYDLAEKLSFYFDKSLYQFVEKYFINKQLGDNDLLQENCTVLVAFLIERDGLTVSQKETWKKRLKSLCLKEAQNKMILRRSIFALGRFRDIKLFTSQLINKILETKDDEVVTSLIHVLSEININHPLSIDCFLRCIKPSSISIRVSARHALYEINSKDGIKRILDKFIEDDALLNSFIKEGSTYNEDNENFVESIKKICDKKIVMKLKEIVIRALSQEIWYKVESSKFIQGIVSLINEYDQNYIFKLIEKSTNVAGENRLSALKDIFVVVLSKADVKKFIETIQNADNKSAWVAFSTLQQIKFSDRQDRKEIYEEGRKYLEREYQHANEGQARFDSEQKMREEKVYKDFKYKLEPKKGEYFPAVFDYYIRNKDRMKPFIQDSDKKRLEFLIKDSIFSKFDPGKQKLTITKQGDGSRSFTTNQWISYFGDCLLVAQELGLKVSSYRQRILSYIPFAYNDHRKAIFDLVPDPTEKELKSILKLYKERGDDLVEYMPSSTIDFFKIHKVTNGIPILKSFVASKQIPIYERQAALLAIAQLSINEKKFFKDIFTQYEKNHGEEKVLSTTANKILIENFEDPSAINWRFKELIAHTFPFKRPQGCHSVGDEEREIDDKEFAQPLVQLKDIKYKEKFLRLLKESLKVFDRGEDYFAYASYLWSVVMGYFGNLKELRSFETLEDIEKFIASNSSQKGISSFCYQYQRLKWDYIIYISKPKNISDCIKKYNYFKEKTYLDVATPLDLFALVKKVINEDLRKWVEDEGAYKFLNQLSSPGSLKVQREVLIQKTINSQLENCLFKAGLREEEMHIIREAQSLDDKRTDFLVSYGFVGSILIEIKLSGNSEITDDKKRSAYKKKLIQQYIKGTNSHYGIFLIFKMEEDHEKFLLKLRDLYIKEKTVEIICLNCA